VGAGLPGYVVIILGLANLFADGVSMAAGAYLSLKSERDQYERIRKEELAEIDNHPEIERAEVPGFLRAKGFAGDDLERAVAIVTGNRNVWADMMMNEEHGLSKRMNSRPWMNALATFLSFVLFGSVPLSPYIFSVFRQSFVLAASSTVVAMLFLGLLRSYVTRERLLRGALEVVGVGVAAAVTAYAVGLLLRGITGALV
jgi:predicted membrane protein (TIGR00267 family)